MSEAIRRPRGRPTQGDTAKRHPIGVRTTQILKERLEAVSAESGRSMAQEIEARLEASFSAEDSLGGTHIAPIARAFAMILAQAEAATGAKWTEDGETWHAAQALVRDLMNGQRPLPANDRQIIKAIAARDSAKAERDAAFAGLASVSEGLLSSIATGKISDSEAADRYRNAEKRLSEAQAALDAAFADADRERDAGRDMARKLLAERD